MENFPCKDETYRILGACFEVYKEKGCGFLEPVYQDCMEVEIGSSADTVLSQTADTADI
jgi:GxxExxY protein